LSNTIKIIKADIPKDKRILVTSDIHGHTEHLRQALKKANFSENDILIIIGDLIEKGPDSLGTVRYVMDLYKRGNVIVLIGNVDNWRMQMIENISTDGADEFYNYLEFMRGWKGTSLFDEMTRELGYTVSSAEELKGCVSEVEVHFKKELDFIRGLPTILETESFIFVHSGLPESGLDGIEERNIYDVLGRAAFLNEDVKFEKYVVVGHYPTALYNNSYPANNPIINKEKRIISIDGGCGLKEDGQLNVLMIPSINCNVADITHIYYDIYPTVTALDEQAESTDSLKIGYLDNRIEVVSEEDELALIRHLSSGRELWIPKSYLHKGGTKCDDCTDYVLPTTSRDTLSLIRETHRGYIVKKNGISGWYFGEIEKKG